jgi:non-specific serine/threonine protein kinase
MGKAVELRISPAGELRARAIEAPTPSPPRVRDAFARGVGEGLLVLGGPLLHAELPRSLAFGRAIARAWYEAVCRAGTLEPEPEPPNEGTSASLLLSIPPITGAEYASPRTIADAWARMHDAARAELAASGDDLTAWLAGKNDAWHGIGRVYFHLAENPRDAEFPFAFVATYVDGLTATGEPLHRTLAHALTVFEKDRDALLRLLRPLEAAAGQSALVRELVDAGAIYRAVRWTSQEAFAFLEQIPACEAAGVLVRVPNWWRTENRRVRVSGRVGHRPPSGLGVDALLDFDVALTFDGQRLRAQEIRALLEGTPGLRMLRGKWVAVDPDQLREALRRFEEVQAQAKLGGLSFAEGMRLLSGIADRDDATPTEQEVLAGKWLDAALQRLRDPIAQHRGDPGAHVRGTLRAYQRDGVSWLRHLWELRLGGCLADDMGLGKTIQVLALLSLLQREKPSAPHLLVVPTSLVANWQAEAERFAPQLRLAVAHRSAAPDTAARPDELANVDAVVTTYGTLLRTPWLRERTWGLVVLDEAQAIKNAATRQARTVKALRSTARLALTGTPVENRLDDLWSIFDFLTPGLLGTGSEFTRVVKRLDRKGEGFAPIRRLVAPYILRRLKSDPAIVPDLPDKTEVDAYCGLSKLQVALYEQSVRSLAQELRSADGIKRRGVVLAYLQRFKQICNHPSQWTGDGSWAEDASGKFVRLRALCEALAARQERVLVFTQFRELTRPLAAFLEGVFGEPGLRLDGRTPVRRRQELVQAFSAEDGPPFFVISLKAGGTGLNLTAASQVIHFDRWWNPAVENQATDRAYRIGQHRNVLVHKLVCRGTLEEKIAAMIRDKQALADEILAADGAARLTEMSTDELMRTVALDLKRAVDGA